MDALDRYRAADVGVLCSDGPSEEQSVEVATNERTQNPSKCSVFNLKKGARFVCPDK